MIACLPTVLWAATLRPPRLGHACGDPRGPLGPWPGEGNNLPAVHGMRFPVEGNGILQGLRGLNSPEEIAAVAYVSLMGAFYPLLNRIVAARLLRSHVMSAFPRPQTVNGLLALCWIWVIPDRYIAVRKFLSFAHSMLRGVLKAKVSDLHVAANAACGR